MQVTLSTWWARSSYMIDLGGKIWDKVAQWVSLCVCVPPTEEGENTKKPSRGQFADRWREVCVCTPRPRVPRSCTCEGKDSEMSSE